MENNQEKYENWFFKKEYMVKTNSDKPDRIHHPKQPHKLQQQECKW